MNDHEHDWRHYLAWEQSLLAQIHAILCGLMLGFAWSTAFSGIDMMRTHIAVSAILLLDAVGLGYFAIGHHMKGRKLTAELRRAGCTDQCWSFRGGLRDIDQGGGR